MRNDALIEAPIIILGAPRSGTSVFGETLSEHPDVFYANERRFLWRYGNDRKSDMLRASDARPAVVEYIRDEFARLVGEAGRRRLVEKQPANSLRPGFVDVVFPDARYIHIRRDPVESVLSIARKWKDAKGLRPGRTHNPQRGSRLAERWGELGWRRLAYYGPDVLRRSAPASMDRLLGPSLWGPRIPGLAEMVRELDIVEVAAVQWRMCVESAARFGATVPDRYMEVDVRDLSSETIRRILDFARLSQDPAVFDYLARKYDRDRISRRMDETPEPDRRRAQELTEATRIWLDSRNGHRSS